MVQCGCNLGRCSTQWRKKIVAYDYFCIIDEELELKHNWDRDRYNKCTSVKYDQYYIRGDYYDSEEEFYKRMNDSIKKKGEYKCKAKGGFQTG